MKTCTKCKNDYPANTDNFAKDKNAKDGLCTQCKFCRRADYKSKYDIIKPKKIEYRKNNAEIIKEKRVIWNNNNRDKINTQSKNWRLSNIEKHKVWRKMWIRNNSEKVYSQAKEWRKNNPFKVKLTYLKSRCKINTPTLKELVTFYNSLITQNGLFPCKYCNREMELMESTIDHIIPLSKGGDNRINNLAIACSFCNTSKGNKIYENID